jgi:hypothetical protein
MARVISGGTIMSDNSSMPAILDVKYSPDPGHSDDLCSSRCHLASRGGAT